MVIELLVLDGDDSRRKTLAEAIEADGLAGRDWSRRVEEGPPEEVFGNPKQARTKQFLEKYKGD